MSITPHVLLSSLCSTLSQWAHDVYAGFDEERDLPDFPDGPVVGGKDTTGRGKPVAPLLNGEKLS